MKKLYRKGTVHPSPSPSTTTSNNNLFSLSYLPATILSLVAALSTDDKQVLAYLLSCSTTPFDFHSSPNKKHNKNNTSNTSSTINNSHATCFTCYCFSCYTTYWARWDASPNRQLIHEIIDALEDNLLAQRMNKKQGVNKKYKKKNVNNKNLDFGLNVLLHDDKFEGSIPDSPNSSRVRSVQEVGVHADGGEKQGIVTKMVSFVWGSVWG